MTHRRAITDTNIRHERPDPALAFLVQAPLLLHTSAEQSFELRGWSPEGWTDCPAVATLTVPFQGVYVSFDVQLAQDAPGGFVRFAGLTARAAGMLDLFHAAILRGEITPDEGILMALDRPVDLVPMTRTEAETGPGPRRPLSRALRAAGRRRSMPRRPGRSPRRADSSPRAGSTGPMRRRSIWAWRPSLR